jgi:hypothetical protein
MFNVKVGLVIICLCMTSILAIAQQASLETFGQNRIQTKAFEWAIYDTTHFRVFYYDYGKYNAQFLLQQAEMDLPSIVKEMGAILPKKLNIILYNSFDDYKQTNTGLYNQEINKDAGGAYESGGSNLVIYFDGTHNGLRTQVRKGISTVLKDNILFGYTVREILKNALKMNLPPWFTDGYVKYVSEDWLAQETNNIKSIIEQKPKFKIDDFASDNTALIGKSIFNYIKNEYGENAVSNLLYMAKSRKKIEEAIAYIVKKPFKTFQNEWKQYYCPTLNKDTTIFKDRTFLGKIKIPHKAILKNFAASPDGKSLAYSEEKDGFYKIKLYDANNNKSFTIIDGGFRSGLDIKDNGYPLIAWSMDGKKLAMVYEKDYKQQIKVYDAKNSKISNQLLNTNRLDRIHSLCFMEDDEKLAISGIRKGQSNLYQLTIKNTRLYPITKDIWDDVHPQYVSGKDMEGILFFSNRTQPYIDVPITNNELPNRPFELFYYSLTGGNLINLSNKNSVPVYQPIQYGSEHLAVLADINGTQQRFIIHKTEVKNKPPIIKYTINAPTSNNIIYHQYNRKANAITELLQRNQYLELYSIPIKLLDTIDKTLGIDTLENLLKTVDTKEIDKSNPVTYYLNEFVNVADSMQSANAINLSTSAKRKFRSKSYKTNFYLDYLQTSLDNSQLFNRYQKIDQGKGEFIPAPLGAMLNTSLIDIMEDHKITAAVRIPDNLATLSYMVKYGNYKKRLDWELSFLHHADTFYVNNTFKDTNDPYYSIYYDELAHQQQNFLQANFIYPFTTTRSFRLSTGFRQDKLRYKARSEYSIKYPINNAYAWLNRLEYVSDQTSSPLKNIYRGFRFKFYTDLILQLSKSRDATINHGMDVRYYTPIYKNIILANRLAGAISYGSRPFKYNLGGIDNELVSSTDSVTPPQPKYIVYGYQAMATNLRGYNMNSGIGNNFFVINEEIRVPIINTLTNKKIKYSSLRNLQLVGFIDAGAAWPDITTGIQDYVFTLPGGQTVNYSGFKIGYGAGARTTILGYYIRADLGWNIDKTKPKLHLSFIHDF